MLNDLIKQLEETKTPGRTILKTYKEDYFAKIAEINAIRFNPFKALHVSAKFA